MGSVKVHRSIQAEVNPMFQRKLAVFGLALVLTASGLLAQSGAQTGQISGTVTDPNGAVVPGAKVTITNMDNGSTREVTSDESGLYRAVLLSAGRYSVTVTSSGFAPAKITDVVVYVEIGRAHV